MTHDSAAATPARRRFAGYELLAELGEHLGVRRYKATQLAMRREVVINVLPAEAARKAMYAAEFERQMRVFSTLRHENVVGAIEAGEFQGERYLVIEHVDGSTLRDELVKAAVWDVPRALRLGRDIARAIVHLEAQKLVHREISPFSITLCEDGTSRLAEFGRAKFVSPGASETWSDTSLGIVLYMAPEVALGRRGVDTRSDIYSLGCVLYHLLVGRPPFYGQNVALVLDALRTRRPRDPRWLRRDLPAPVVRVLDRCLRKNQADRYPTAAALCADIETLLAGRAPAGAAPPGSAWEKPFDGKA